MRVQHAPRLSSIICDNEDETRTIFFALKAYRDSLVDSLIKTAKQEFDPEDYFSAEELDEDQHGNEFITPILNLNDNVALGWEKGCNEFEDLAFLHHELFKVNSALHALAEDNNLGGPASNEKFGWL